MQSQNLAQIMVNDISDEKHQIFLPNKSKLTHLFKMAT